MAQSNVEAVRAVYERWGAGDFRASLAVMDPDVVFVMPPDLPDSGTYRGLEELAEYMRHFFEAWMHITIEAEELFDGGDTVVAAIRQHATGSATGIETEMRYFQVWSFSGEKVIRLENTRDRVRAFDAAGLRE
jgi:ketosteroid isomerase-like protein